MSRWKRLLWGSAVTVTVVLVLELSARAYSRFHYGNSVAMTYGGAFIGRFLDGTVALEVGWGAGRGGDKAADDRSSAEGLDVQALFDRRDDKNDGLVLRQPQVVTFNGGFSATINSLSFRGPDPTPEIAPGGYRVAVFGGSYVFGAYLRDDQTWAHLLETGLRARGLPVEVVNAGTSGANIHGVMADVIRLTNRIHINTAVVTSGYNNHPLLPIARKYPLIRRADFYAYNLSLFYVMVKERMAKVISQPLDYGLYNQPVEVRADDVDWLVALYKKRLDQIATICEERGIRLVLASEGERFFRSDLNKQSSQTPAVLEALAVRVRGEGQLTMAELEYYLQGHLNRAAREVAEARGARFFDGEATLLQDKSHIFADQIHPNEIGAARLAKGLEAFLASDAAAVAQ